MTLAELVSRRLLAAGFHYDDPALVAIRRHNAAVYARHAGKESSHVDASDAGSGDRRLPRHLPGTR